MTNKILSLVITSCLFLPVVKAQVQVSKEPFHVPVFQNKYIRLLDVWLQPGDTTGFHIHSTPSVFIFFSNTTISSETQGKEWISERAVAGKAWYRSFTPDSLIHRVSNIDTVPLHVNDIEILSFYDRLSAKEKLAFPVLFENEKVTAYNLAKKDFTTGTIKDRGPIVAELVSGDKVYYMNMLRKEKKEIKPGQFLYIEPGSSFHFAFKGKGSMVLFEFK